MAMSLQSLESLWYACVGIVLIAVTNQNQNGITYAAYSAVMGIRDERRSRQG